MEEFTRQQIFAQAAGAEEINQVTRELIARIILNAPAVFDVHIGNNVN